MGSRGDSNDVAKRIRFVRVAGMIPLARLIEAVDGYVRLELDGIPRVVPEWAVSEPCKRCVNAQLLGNYVPKLCVWCNAVGRERSPSSPSGVSR